MRLVFNVLAIGLMVGVLMAAALAALVEQRTGCVMFEDGTYATP